MKFSLVGRNYFYSYYYLVSTNKQINMNLNEIFVVFVKCTSEIFKIAHLTPFFDNKYPFSILYLPTQIQMDIVYQKLVLNANFQDF